MPDPLLLTAGKLTRKVIAPVHEAHLRHRLVKPLLILRVAVQKVRQHDIFITASTGILSPSLGKTKHFSGCSPFALEAFILLFSHKPRQITCIRIVKSQDTG